MKGNAAVFLIQVLSSLAFFVATIIVARYLGPEHFGDFSAAYSVASVAYILCLLGADITAVNVIAMSLKVGEKGTIKAFVIYVFFVVAALTVVYYIIAFIGYWIAKDVLHFKDTHPVFVAVIFIPFMSLAFFFYRVFISLFKPVMANMFFKIIINFSMLILATLMFVSEIFRNSYMAVIIFMLPWVLAFVVMFVYFVKKVEFFASTRKQIEYKSWLNSGLSGLPYTLALFTIPYLSIIGAEVFLTDESSVGVFATAASLSQLVSNNFIAYIQSIALAPIATAIHNDEYHQIRKIINKNAIAMTIVGFMLVIIVYFFGSNILMVYGENYLDGNEILLVFMIIQSVVLVGCLAAPTLLYMGKNKLVAISSILLVFLIVVTVSIFGYIFQEFGIVYSILVSVVLVFAVQNVYAYRLTFESARQIRSQVL